MPSVLTDARRMAASLLAATIWAGANQAAPRQIDPLYQAAGSAQAHLAARARALTARGDFAGAVVAFDKAIALQPGWAALITERAFALEALGNLEGAQVDYDTVLRLAPDRANSWSHAAWIRALRDTDLDQALAHCDKARAIESNIDVLDTRGFVHFRRGEFGQALVAYDAALALFPRSASTLYMRGVVKRRLDDRPAGDADIAKAVKIDSGVAARWTRRGVTP